ncbi:hypothetical protein LR48_Vigan10g086000 [Vigna angularis]|uniref:Uncharacterized protein n=1 Tax=Phaseolus angularis TaxID=3914 RepID=A0A0L9VJ27_PHAAN|nr:hypothetical protein LR48_Vigan10g086000 [Vigna angularis]
MDVSVMAASSMGDGIMEIFGCGRDEVRFMCELFTFCWGKNHLWWYKGLVFFGENILSWKKMTCCHFQCGFMASMVVTHAVVFMVAGDFISAIRRDMI